MFEVYESEINFAYPSTRSNGRQKSRTKGSWLKVINFAFASKGHNRFFGQIGNG